MFRHYQSAEVSLSKYRAIAFRVLASFILLILLMPFAHAAEPKAAAQPQIAPSKTIDFISQSRPVNPNAPNEFSIPKKQQQRWLPAATALIICDVWDSHHCLNAVRRETEMIPRMNEFTSKLREQGVLVIHAPSECMPAYAEHPARLRAMAAPPAPNLPAEISKWCHKIPAEERAIYPIDQSDGGEDDDPTEHAAWHQLLTPTGRNPKLPWKRQHQGIVIDATHDAISDSGTEIWNLLEQRGITNVMLCGVHTNMCVLGRPFGLRRMAENKKNVVLVRDLTDTMYNPAAKPFVSHYAGTQLILRHIESFVCPTTTSAALIGGEEFRFANDRRNIVVMIGEDEYETETTLRDFVIRELLPLGYNVTPVLADKLNKHSFPGLEKALANADLLLVSVRRRTPPRAQLDAIRAHISAGKPLVGIRTASHAFAVRDPASLTRSAEQEVWPEFDAEILGGHYTGHHGDGVQTTITATKIAATHPILRGVAIEKFVVHGTLYETGPLASPRALTLLMGKIPDQKAEPLAWTNITGPKDARVFYTSLGHKDDFADPVFRKLLLNGITWSLDRNVWTTGPKDLVPK